MSYGAREKLKFSNFLLAALTKDVLESQLDLSEYLGCRYSSAGVDAIDVDRR